jgi:hypothetical protein
MAALRGGVPESEVFRAIAQIRFAYGDGRNADAPDMAVQAMQCASPFRVRRMKCDAEGNGNAVSVLGPMWSGDRDVHTMSRLEVERHGGFLKGFLESKVPVADSEAGLDLFV